MWQKERLLNIALGSLPADCDTVAWVDCDVLFGTDDWPVQAGRALDRYGLVHLFEERHNVPGRTLPESDCARSAVNAQSVVSRIARGKAVHEDLADANAPVSRGSTAGLAWASRRHILERHGFYDACILGTGDRAMLCAALGRFDCAIEAMRMNPARARHYLAWAKSYFETVGGQVGWITGTAYHLWHGDPGNRRYADRHRWLDSFDPATDIALDQNRCWRWSSNKPELHAVVRQYFELRDEDRPS
jgi:hypothetical protein